jgi:2-polyprenyl-3-methyl-5-hydroxy-6-metoxy-1,4-benzoquinol methylase
MAPHPTPNPGLIFEELNAFHRSLALRGAIELELFTHIDNGASTVAELAKRTSASERGVRILCDYLTIQGWLTKQDQAYGLSLNSKLFLSKNSPSYLGAMANFLAHDEMVQTFSDVAGAVRKGGTTQSKALEPENSIWVDFAKSMAGMMGAVAGQVSAAITGDLAISPKKVLDISAGHGMFGIAMGKAAPQAQIVGLDWANVLEVAKENAKLAGLGDRYSVIAGSAFDADFGSGYDLVLVPNFCHHFDQPTNVKLLRKVHQALTPGGTCAIVEFIPNDDRVSPPQSAFFSFVMLNATPSGDAYTFAEFQRMASEAGFASSSMLDLGQSPQRMVVAKA